MSNGNKNIVINTRERVISSDINRLQSFEAQQRSDTWKDFANIRRAANLNHLYTQAEWPDPLPANDVPHDVIGGLMVRPDNAGFLLVDPGTAGIIMPGTGGPDDSEYVVVRSAGVSDNGTLTFTANASGSARIDVVECRAVATVLETSNRDIFDPSTGTFTPQTVNKVIKHELEFRVVVGTPGAGLRVPDSEWCPLAIVFVQDGASGFDVCDVYDVRPLVAARVDPYGRFKIPESGNSGIGLRPTYRHMELQCGGGAAADVSVQGGYYRAEWGGYVVGGKITGTSVRAAVDFGSAHSFEMTDAENQLSGLSIGSGGHKHYAICAYFPGGYPRWVRYDEFSSSADPDFDIHVSGRLPGPHSGILMMTAENQVREMGITNPQSGFPAVFGGLSDAIGILVGVVKQGADSQIRATMGNLSQGFSMGHYDSSVATQALLPFAASVSVVGTTLSWQNVTIPEATASATGIPGGVTAVLLFGAGTWTTTLSSVEIKDIRRIAYWDSTAAVLSDLGADCQVTSSLNRDNTDHFFSFATWVPTPLRFFDQNREPVTFVQRITHDGSGLSAQSMSVGIVGYRLN